MLTIHFLVYPLSEANRKAFLSVEVNAFGRPLGTQAGLAEFPHSTCSPLHAYLYQGEAGEIRLTDMNTETGTWINGRLVADIAIKAGDEIRFGDLRLVVLPDSPSPKTSI